MKKKNVINLIKYYTERNDAAFRDEAYEIAVAFTHGRRALRPIEAHMALCSPRILFPLP